MARGAVSTEESLRLAPEHVAAKGHRLSGGKYLRQAQEQWMWLGRNGRDAARLSG